MQRPGIKLAPDPAPERIKVLLFATPPIGYVAETASEWAEKGFSGFIRPDIMKGWNADVWSLPDGRRLPGHDNPYLQQCRSMNAALADAGLCHNFMCVPFTVELPDWFDGEKWAAVCENFRQGARFARLAGFRGMALDDEYIEDSLGLNWAGYRKPGYPVDKLFPQARLRGQQIQKAMLSEFPDMVTLHLPESYSIMGDLAKALFLGYLDALCAADAPGGLDILPECTYFQTDPWWIALYGAGLDQILREDLLTLDSSGRLSDYWDRRCGIALGQAPLGYLRFIRDADGKRIGYGGREEVFGNRIIEGGEDKSGNYPASVFRETHAAVRTVSRRYEWVFCPGPVWWQMSEEQWRRHGGPQVATLPLVPEFSDYTLPLRRPEIAVGAAYDVMRNAVKNRTPANMLSGLGMPPSWWVNGPYDNSGGKGYDHVLAPEQRIDLEMTSPGVWGGVGWKQVNTPPTGYVDLSRLIAGGSEIQGYAATWCETETEISVVVHFGCDDTGKIWCNGNLVHESKTERIAVPDEDSFPLVLPTGRSVFLLKIGNYRGGWGFYFRITDSEGNEIPSLRWDLRLPLNAV